MLIIQMLINIFQLSYMSHYLAWYKWSIGSVKPQYMFYHKHNTTQNN